MYLLKDRGFNHRTPSDITPEAVYHARREWLQRAAWGLAGAGLGPWAASEAKMGVAELVDVETASI